MLNDIEKMFSNRKEMLQHLGKKVYEKNMTEFLKQNQHYYEEMIRYVDSVSDKETAVKEIGICFVDGVESAFAAGRKNKISARTQMDLNLFMVYYGFPGLLKTGHPECRMIAEGIRREWSSRFKNSDIGYTDYDSLYNSFTEKLFGFI